MFWRAIRNAKLLRHPDLVLPFCLRLEAQKAPHHQSGGERPVLEYGSDQPRQAGQTPSTPDPNGG